MKTQIGEYTFLAGIVLAILTGLVAFSGGWTAVVLVVLGVIVGLLNITEKDTTPFLVSTIALLLTGSAGLDKLPMAGTYLASIISNILVFVAPAAAIVALKTIFDMARKK
ncbi:MAG: hypothetical protein QW423_00605 [Candidatus Aenigmatarchaeota archaeon]